MPFKPKIHAIGVKHACMARPDLPSENNHSGSLLAFSKALHEHHPTQLGVETLVPLDRSFLKSKEDKVDQSALRYFKGVQLLAKRKKIPVDGLEESKEAKLLINLTFILRWTRHILATTDLDFKAAFNQAIERQTPLLHADTLPITRTAGEYINKTYTDHILYIPELIDALCVARSKLMYDTAIAKKTSHMVIGATHLSDLLELGLVKTDHAHFIGATEHRLLSAKYRLSKYKLHKKVMTQLIKLVK